MSWGLRILKYCLQYRHETICNIFKKGNFSSEAQSVKWAFCCCGCYQSKEAKLFSVLLLRSYFSWKFEDASMFFFGAIWEVGVSEVQNDLSPGQFNIPWRKMARVRRNSAKRWTVLSPQWTLTLLSDNNTHSDRGLFTQGTHQRNK